MTSRRWIQLALGATTGLVLTWLLLGRLAAPPDEPPGTAEFLLDAPLPPPTLDLTSHTGVRVGLEAFRGQAVAVFFGYTHCPDVCPLTLSHLSRVLGKLGGDARRLQVLFVSVDPARDTPERLTRFLQAFHPSIVALTGTDDEVRAQARGFGVGIVVPEHEPGANYLVDHTARTFLLDGEGRMVGSVSATASYDDVRRAVGVLLRTLGS